MYLNTKNFISLYAVKYIFTKENKQLFVTLSLIYRYTAPIIHLLVNYCAIFFKSNSSHFIADLLIQFKSPMI